MKFVGVWLISENNFAIFSYCNAPRQTGWIICCP